MLELDRSGTVRRRSELIAYLSSEVDDGQQLLCSSAQRCRSSLRADQQFVEGQLSHVGECFDLVEEGRPLRLLIVSKQVGGSLDDGGGRGHQHVTVEGRRQQVETAKYGKGPHPRTNHMIGTELAVKVLLGLDPHRGAALSISGVGSRHVFDCMAMVNATLCSRAYRDASGQGSDRMFELCRRHLAESIRILKPTVVLAQGWTQRSALGKESSVASTVAAVLGVPVPRTDPSVVRTHMAWGSVAFITSYHPSRHWFNTSMPYWKRLEPVLRDARAFALAVG